MQIVHFNHHHHLYRLALTTAALHVLINGMTMQGSYEMGLRRWEEKVHRMLSYCTNFFQSFRFERRWQQNGHCSRFTAKSVRIPDCCSHNQLVPNQQSSLRLIIWDKTFTEPVPNTQFLTRTLLIQLHDLVLTILRKHRLPKCSMQWETLALHVP